MRDLGSGALKQETISDTRNYLVLCFWGRDGQHVLYSWSTVPSLYLLLFLVQQGLPSPFCEVLGHCDKFQKQSAITAILLSTPYCKKVVSSQPNKVVGWCAFILPARASDLPGKEQQVTSALPLAACGALLAPAFPGQCLLRGRHSTRTLPARPLSVGTARHGHKHGHRQCSSGGQSLASGCSSVLLVVRPAGRKPHARFWRLMFPVTALTAAACCTRKKLRVMSKKMQILPLLLAGWQIVFHHCYFC